MKGAEALCPVTALQLGRSLTPALPRSLKRFTSVGGEAETPLSPVVARAGGDQPGTTHPIDRARKGRAVRPHAFRERRQRHRSMAVKGCQNRIGDDGYAMGLQRRVIDAGDLPCDPPQPKARTRQ